MSRAALTFSLVILSVTGLSVAALADDFGPRFYDKTPAGLADYTVEEMPDIAMDNLAKELNEIMPAAGEEETVNDAEKAEQTQEDRSAE